jgi:hypothetical protein
MNEIQITENTHFDTEEVYGVFGDFEFGSMLKEKTWNKYVDTFIPLTKD